MNISANNRAFLALVALLLSVSMLFVACQGDKQVDNGTTEASTLGQASAPETSGTENTTQAQTGEQGSEQQTLPGDTSDRTSAEETATEPAPSVPTVTYTVTVIGSDGLPRQGAAVRFYKGSERIGSATTDSNGIAIAQLVPDTYDVAIDNILGETYFDEGCTVTPESTSLSVVLYGQPAKGGNIYAYSAKADDYVSYATARIGEGKYAAPVSAEDMTYYLFVAPRGGVFRLSVDSDLPISIGYYGSTSYVLTEAASLEQDNAITVDVYDDMVHNYEFVIGLQAESADVTSCVLTVEYVSERKPTTNDMPWNDLMPTGTLTQFTKPAGTLRPFDVTDVSLTAVYNREDGYYHVGSADGPVLMLSLDNDSPYLDALTTVCNHMRLGVYVYDDAGNVISKDSYNELIWAYNAVSDGGYYPLDKTLADMMIAVGEYMGWYDASSPMYLFGQRPLVPEAAHLFACYYVE